MAATTGGATPATVDPSGRRLTLVPSGVGVMPLACAIVVLVVVALAALTWNSSPYYGRSEAAPAKPPAANVGTVPTTGPADLQLARTHAVLISPKRIVIPALSAHAKIIDVGTTSDGELDVPADPKVVGWWSPGRKPGSATGTAILAGHINYAGVTGTLAQIGTLQPGDTVKIFGINAGHRAEVTFRVSGVRTYHKSALPYRKIFNQQGAGRIAIVTCGGPFDASTGNYLDNIVAYAVPVVSA